jgi:hypothetical protein
MNSALRSSRDDGQPICEADDRCRYMLSGAAQHLHLTVAVRPFAGTGLQLHATDPLDRDLDRDNDRGLARG